MCNVQCAVCTLSYARLEQLSQLNLAWCILLVILGPKWFSRTPEGFLGPRIWINSLPRLLGYYESWFEKRAVHTFLDMLSVECPAHSGIFTFIWKLYSDISYFKSIVIIDSLDKSLFCIVFLWRGVESLTLFLAVQSSSRSLVVGRSVRRSERFVKKWSLEY